jgi:Dolichyl-phosphate-mannose-protein mannosyltransferase
MSPIATSAVNARRRRSWLLLSLVVAISFAIRLVALAYWQAGAIQPEGSEYARIAENLRNGAGYVGGAYPGAQLIFNPLFPWLIAAASLVTHNYEWAGRLVSLILGSLLPFPVFGITSHLFNRRAGFIAAALTLLHPVLIALSVTVFSEGPYLTLLMCSVYATLRVLNISSVRPWIFMGGAFGLSYLIRAEAVAAFAIAVLFAFAVADGTPSAKCKRASATIALFLFLALPEVVFLYKHTGKIGLEEKGPIFFATSSRDLTAEASLAHSHRLPDGQPDNEPAGVPISAAGALSPAYKWAQFAIDGNLVGTGVAMRPNADVIRETPTPLTGLVHLFERGLRQNAPTLASQLSSSWLPLFLPWFALLGAFGRPWQPPQASYRFFFLLVMLAPLTATFFSLLWAEPRFYFVFIPFLLVWASNGIVEFGLWIKESSAAVGWRLLSRSSVSDCIIPCLIGLAIVLLPIRGVKTLSYFAVDRSSKEIGMWIGQQQNHPVRIMDTTGPLVFHADAQLVHFPYCTPELALRFLDSAHVDYVVLRRGEIYTQYYEDWLTRGIPDVRAELLHIPVGDASKLVVFRWRQE